MNTSRPTVSVIIPTWNRAPWLRETLRSVTAQTWLDYELLVVDDGSTDNTGDLLREFPGIACHRLEKNHGVSTARNWGLNQARGRYICFLDSDDLWRPEKLEIQVRRMEEQPDCLISYTDEIWIRNRVRVNPGKRHQKLGGYIFKHCLPLCLVSPSSAMMRRTLLSEVGGFDEALPACEDYDLWLRIAARHPFDFIPEKLIVKRGGHPDQLSKKYWGMDRFRIYALEKLLHQERLELEQGFQVMETLVKKAGILAKGFFKRDKTDEGEYYKNLAEKYTAVLRGEVNLTPPPADSVEEYHSTTDPARRLLW